MLIFFVSESIIVEVATKLLIALIGMRLHAIADTYPGQKCYSGDVLTSKHQQREDDLHIHSLRLVEKDVTVTLLLPYLFDSELTVA